MPNARKKGRNNPGRNTIKQKRPKHISEDT